MKQMVLLGMAQALFNLPGDLGLHRGLGQSYSGHCQSQHLCVPPQNNLCSWCLHFNRKTCLFAI